MGRGKEERKNTRAGDEDRMSSVGEWGHEQPHPALTSSVISPLPPLPPPPLIPLPPATPSLGGGGENSTVGKVSYVISIDYLWCASNLIVTKMQLHVNPQRKPNVTSYGCTYFYVHTCSCTNTHNQKVVYTPGKVERTPAYDC